MTREQIKSVQLRLKEAGFYEGEIDGIWGKLSENALEAALMAAGLRAAVHTPPKATTPPVPDGMKMAWGQKVSRTFKERVLWICGELGIDPDDLMACMAWESAETFRADIKNAAGSGATGLIQFMPATARGLGTTTLKLAQMTPEDQLNYVYKYFAPWKGRLKTVGDLYMAILWPVGVGKPDSYVLFDRDDRDHPKRYLQNKGIDANRDGKVTKAEATAKVVAKLIRGRLPEYYG